MEITELPKREHRERYGQIDARYVGMHLTARESQLYKLLCKHNVGCHVTKSRRALAKLMDVHPSTVDKTLPQLAAKWVLVCYDHHILLHPGIGHYHAKGNEGYFAAEEAFLHALAAKGKLREYLKG